MTVKVEMQGEIALITMDDGKANAVNPLLLDALNTALDEAEAKAKAIVIAGRPGRFSAGFDLNILTGGSIDDAIGLVKYGGRTALRMYGSDKPIVAACPGHAIAMGSFFLLSTDYRIGTPGAFKIGANESAIGMVIPEFAAELLMERIARPYLTRAMVNGTLFGPDEAMAAGFLDELAAPEELIDKALSQATLLSQLTPVGFAGNKQLMRAGLIAKCKPGVQPS